MVLWLSFFIHPSVQSTTHSVLSTDRPGNQFGVWERKESSSLPFHPGQVIALSPQGLQVLREPKKHLGAKALKDHMGDQHHLLYHQ